jgi:anaerobic C4-dicarboxylate transporter
MDRDRRHLLVLGLVVLALAGLVFWAISVDVQTGVVETVRPRRVIGDALAPTVAACMLLAGGLLLLIERPAAPLRLNAESWRFIAAVAAILTVALILMRGTGPAPGPICRPIASCAQACPGRGWAMSQAGRF